MIERWSREQGWENLHNEDGEKHRSKEEQDNTGECANVQESVTEPVPSPVSVRNSSEFLLDRCQVSDCNKLAGATGIEPAHVQRQRRMSWPQRT